LEINIVKNESTVKINFETGNYAKMHVQFRGRKMSCEEVIDYIVAYDEWRQKQG
jgi:translation initiation factor IF-3